MKSYAGKTLSWELREGVIELALEHEPCNEIGSATLAELEQFVEALKAAENEAHAVIVYSKLKQGFSAGADLRELYKGIQGLPAADRHRSSGTKHCRV